MAEPKKEAKKKMSTIKLISIMVVIGLASLAWGALSRHKNNPQGAQGQTVVYQSQTLIATNGGWVGIGVPPGKRINAWPMNDNVNYKVRLDKKPNRVHHISSTDGPGEALVDIGKFKYIEFQLEDRSIAECEILHEFVDR
jgi:hypothetical protein